MKHKSWLKYWIFPIITIVVIAVNASILFLVFNCFQKSYLGHVQTKPAENLAEFNRNSYSIPKILDVKDAENYATKYHHLLYSGTPMNEFGNVTKQRNGTWTVEFISGKSQEITKFCTYDIKSDGTLLYYTSSGQAEYC